MTENLELITLRVSMYRISQALGLREEKPVHRMGAENDRGWNRLAAEIRCAIEDLQKERDAAINANYEVHNKMMKEMET